MNEIPFSTFNLEASELQGELNEKNNFQPDWHNPFREVSHFDTMIEMWNEKNILKPAWIILNGVVYNEK